MLLCIGIGTSDSGDIRFHGTVCEWTRNAQRWWEPRNAWIDEHGALWFVGNAGDTGPAFRVDADRLERVDDHPTGDLAAGFDRTRTLFAYLEER